MTKNVLFFSTLSILISACGGGGGSSAPVPSEDTTKQEPVKQEPVKQEPTKEEPVKEEPTSPSKKLPLKNDLPLPEPIKNAKKITNDSVAQESFGNGAYIPIGVQIGTKTSVLGGLTGGNDLDCGTQSDDYCYGFYRISKQNQKLFIDAWAYQLTKNEWVNLKPEKGFAVANFVGNYEYPEFSKFSINGKDYENGNISKLFDYNLSIDNETKDIRASSKGIIFKLNVASQDMNGKKVTLNNGKKVLLRENAQQFNTVFELLNKVYYDESTYYEYATSIGEPEPGEAEADSGRDYKTLQNFVNVNIDTSFCLTPHTQRAFSFNEKTNLLEVFDSACGYKPSGEKVASLTFAKRGNDLFIQGIDKDALEVSSQYRNKNYLYTVGVNSTHSDVTFYPGSLSTENTQFLNEAAMKQIMANFSNNAKALNFPE